jgi:DNA-directed RNA polymerase specialized sigma24 family protein
VCITIEDISKRNEEWLRIAVYCGATQGEAKDIVQDMYLKLCEKQAEEGDLCSITYEDKINMVYMFSILNNAVISLRRKKTEDRFILNYHDTQEETEGINEIKFNALTEKIYKTLEELHWYDRKLFMIYINSGNSIRALASKTGISRTSINNTLQNVKQIIRDKHGKEVEQTHGKTEKKACKPSKKSRFRGYD